MTFKEKTAQMSEDKLRYQAMLRSAGMSMRWYDFLVKIAIPFRIMFEALSSVVNIATAVSRNYGGDFWGYLTHPQLFLSNIIFVVLPILDIAILLIISRNLFTFDKNSPKSLLLFLYVNIAAYALIFLNVLAVAGSAADLPSMIGQCLGPAIVYFCNFIYFYKRKHLFTQSESHAHQNPAKTTKTVYCKLCGSAIDGATRKCSGCGKQYFHLTVRPRSIAAMAAVLLVFSSMAYGMYKKDQQIAALQTDLETTSEQLDVQLERINELEVEILSSDLKYSSALSKADFLDLNVALVSDSQANIYHRFECSLISGDETYFALIDDLIYIGYSSCNSCLPRS